MKITSTPVKTALAGLAATTRTGNAASAGSSSAGAGGKASVDLSPAARHLSGLQNSDSDIDIVRVNEIRDALASGELKIDPNRIADGLLASVRDLLK